VAGAVLLRRLVIASAAKPAMIPVMIDSQGKPGMLGSCNGVVSELVVTVDVVVAVALWVSTEVSTEVDVVTSVVTELVAVLV